MSEKRFIRNIVGDIYDSKKDKWFEEDFEGKPLDYDDDLIVFLNEQQATIEQLQEENKELKDWKKRMIEYLSDWFEKTEYLSVLYKINEIRIEIGLDSDE